MNDFILLTIIVVLTGVCLVLSDRLARRYCTTPAQLIGLALLTTLLLFGLLVFFAGGLVITLEFLEWLYE